MSWSLLRSSALRPSEVVLQRNLDNVQTRRALRLRAVQFAFGRNTVAEWSALLEGCDVLLGMVSVASVEPRSLAESKQVVMGAAPVDYLTQVTATA